VLCAGPAVPSVSSAGELVGEDKVDADRAVCEVPLSRSVEESACVILDD
jgi:hypothetical protein